MPLLIDTSAWSRRNAPEVRDQLERLIADDGPLVLSPSVLLELLRAPQGKEVAEERARLNELLEVVAADAATFELAADAMERLALYQPEAHRLPLADLVTAALADQHGYDVVHCDGDFECIAEHTDLDFGHHQIEVPATSTEQAREAAR